GLMMSDVNAERWPLRTAKAAATRKGIIEAASRLFVELGYAGASVQAVADAAGISRATVFNSVGGKSALLKACYDVATVGDDEPIALPQRRDMLAVRDEPDQRRMIRRYASVIAEIGSRLSGIYEVFRAAAATASDIRELWEQIQDERLGGARGFVAILAGKGPLRSQLDGTEAGDVVWAHIDASLYHRLVVERGWSRLQFEEWFTQSLTSYLLPPGRSSTRTSAS
ncbi:MAG: hypothetical protein QOG39_1688, partial [Acidimicrobiaceae bacterium]